MPSVTVIGGGLAGCEAAWQLAQRGHRVALVEMKPVAMSPAHQTPLLCELVCSNSLRSDQPDSPAGLLKAELRAAGSLVIDAAERHRVPAGSALAVERRAFGREVTVRLALHPQVRIERRVIDEIPAGQTILATGPLTGGRLAAQIRGLLGGDNLYFYDAIAPIVAADSIDPARSFRASRWDRGITDGSEGGGDYLNCPMDRDQYERFVDEVARARKVLPHPFEEARFFEGCLPIEVMVERGLDVLRHGPMRPIGLVDPRTGKRPYAVVQLRPENQYGTAFNLVGFQTRLAYPEQKRIFSLIPALERAEFLRFGAIHRNTYIDSPRLLGPGLELVTRPTLRIAGLLTGVEGYIESCALGLLAALFTDAAIRGVALGVPPATTALGGLYRHVTRARAPGEKFSPSNINFGLLPPIEGRRPKRERRAQLAERALTDASAWLASLPSRAA